MPYYSAGLVQGDWCVIVDESENFQPDARGRVVANHGKDGEAAAYQDAASRNRGDGTSLLGNLDAIARSLDEME